MEFNKELRPKVGIGVYIINKEGQVLLMKRKSAHAEGTWCPPGGHLENGESFFDCCKREVKEETNLDITGTELLGVVNNIFSPEKHYVNVDFVATGVTGELKNMEPEKASDLGWYNLDFLPQPLMLSVQNLFKELPETVSKLKQTRGYHG